MNKVEALPFSAPRHATLRIEDDAERQVHWCYMHNRQTQTGRACFRPQLVDDILTHQKALGERLRQRESGTLAHVVLASDSDVFNLGGDLELFCAAIREQDRATLLAYARRCVLGVYAFHDGLGADAHSIALVQGDALGGGFEAALSCHTIVAEQGARMGLPEVLFDLFPGMGAYSFLCQRIAPHAAEKLMIEGNVYPVETLHRMGLVDVVVPRGQGHQAVEDVIRANRRIAHARVAMHRVRGMARPVRFDELMRITEVWVDTALQLGERSLRTMERLVRAQYRRQGGAHAATA